MQYFTSAITPDAVRMVERLREIIHIVDLCGMAEIERQQREFFAAFAGSPIRYFALWPYDEGGCLCEQCYTWATNGFLHVAKLSRRLIREYGYDAEIIISTRHFDVAMDGEWQGFYNEKFSRGAGRISGVDSNFTRKMRCMRFVSHSVNSPVTLRRDCLTLLPLEFIETNQLFGDNWEIKPNSPKQQMCNFRIP